MNLDEAIRAHADWKLKLRAAITRKEQLDSATIGRDDCCPLGKWIHGEGRSLLGKHAEFVEVRDKHRGFHQQAGAVAREINEGRYAEAEKMLDNGTAYARASQEVGVAVQKLKKLTLTSA